MYAWVHFFLFRKKNSCIREYNEHWTISYSYIFVVFLWGDARCFDRAYYIYVYRIHIFLRTELVLYIYYGTNTTEIWMVDSRDITLMHIHIIFYFFLLRMPIAHLYLYIIFHFFSPHIECPYRPKVFRSI